MNQTIDVKSNGKDKSQKLLRVLLILPVLMLSFQAMGSIGLAADTQTEPLNSKNFQELLAGVLQTDPRIVRAESSLEQSKQQLRIAWAKWFPTIDITGHYGYEEIDKGDGTASTYFNNRKAQAKLTQLIYDFEKTNTEIREAKTKLDNSDLALSSARESVILEGVTAYLNLLRAYERFKYAKTSEGNIQRQTGMEEARVQRGSGLSTDVLQSKSQLAGAMAGRVSAEGAMVNAINRYRVIFQSDPPPMASLRKPAVPYDLLPKTLEEVVETAMANNLTLKQSEVAVELAKLSKKKSVTQFFPEFKLIGQSQFKEDDAGTEFWKNEHTIKIDFTYPLFKSGANVAGLRSARAGLTGSKQSLVDRRRLTEESARNSWQNLLTSRTNAQFLRNQANISGEFLALARKERKLGRRSLLDVLSGETSYLNALSSAVSAETDMALAFYNLLSVMGQLEFSFMDVMEKDTGEAAQAPQTS